MRRRTAAALAAACVALLLWSSAALANSDRAGRSRLFVPPPLGPARAARTASRISSWTRSDPHRGAKMALMDSGTAGPDPYNVDLARQRLKEQQELFDNLLSLKEKLREELPLLFIHDLDSSLFSEDVVFKEPHLPPIRGRKNYKVFIRSLRDTGKLLFEDPSFQVLRATEHAEDGLVKVRWKISGKYQGLARSFWGAGDGCFDGISYYYVAGSSGLVSVHQVDYQTPIDTFLPAKETLAWSKSWARLAAPGPTCTRVLPSEMDAES